MRTPTVRDVAALAGVSTATVSRVLSGDGAVRDTTRRKVTQAAEQLGYQPSSLPSTMRRRRSRSFGVVVSDIENPFFTAVIRGCEREAHDLGYRLVLVNTDEDEQKEEAALRALASDRVAGAVLASSGRDHRGVHALSSIGAPVVAIDNQVPTTQVDFVTVDNMDAARRATEHLLALGHERITMLSGPASASSVAQREAGFREALAGHRRAENSSHVVSGDLREAGAYRAGLDLLTQADRPTAIFTVNNLSTMGVLRAAHALHVQLPTDLSLVGFDDVPLSTVLDPPLTVVTQPTDEIGRAAVRRLAWRLEHADAPPVRQVLPTDFVVRGSTAPPPDVPTPSADHQE